MISEASTVVRVPQEFPRALRRCDPWRSTVDEERALTMEMVIRRVQRVVERTLPVEWVSVHERWQSAPRARHRCLIDDSQKKWFLIKTTSRISVSAIEGSNEGWAVYVDIVSNPNDKGESPLTNVMRVKTLGSREDAMKIVDCITALIAA